MRKMMYSIVLYSSLVFGAGISQISPSEMIMMNSYDDEEFEVVPASPSNTGQSSSQESSVDIGNDVLLDPDFSTLGDSDHIKVALLVPKKIIGHYANAIANSTIAYFLYKANRFQLEVFDCSTESDQNIQLALGKIRHKGYRFIIAPMTSTGADIIASYEKKAFVFIPTVNKLDVLQESNNMMYGGIDYNAQIEALLQYSGEKIAIFSDESKLSQKITDTIIQRKFESIVYNKKIKNIKANISYLFRKNHKLTESSIFLNMPVVKSALVASQFTRYKVKMNNILSTQVNYSPMLLTLTQFQDRENFYIANSIGKLPLRLQDINLLLGENINYNWIDYATSVGLDYVYTTYFTRMGSRIFHEEIVNNQILYDISIMKAMQGSFRLLDVMTPGISYSKEIESWQ